MNARLKYAVAAVAVTLVETACLAVLVRPMAVRPGVALAVAFAIGYVTLFVAVRILSPSGADQPLGGRLQTYALFGVAVLLVAELVLYLGDDVFGLHLALTNTLALVAAACWLAFGWPFIHGSARAPSGEPEGGSRDRSD